MVRLVPVLGALVFTCLSILSSSAAQDSSELANRLSELRAFPDLIVYNGRIHMMDETLTVVDAMAVRDGRVLVLGDNQEVRSLAGPQSQLLDARGRTVLPGIIDTHTHPHAWLVQHRLHNGDAEKFDPQLKITYARGRTPIEVVDSVANAIKMRAAELGPGKWVWITMYPDAEEAGLGPKDENLDEAKKMATSIFERRLLTSALLDRMAPENPTIVFAPTATGSSVSNSMADRLMAEVLGTPVSGLRAIYTLPYDIILRDRPEAAMELLRMEMQECLLDKGVTTIASHIESPWTLKLLNRMANSGKLPVRWAWVHRIGYSFAENPEDFYRWIGDIRGQGNDFFWNMGTGGEGWEDRRSWACTRAKPLPGQTGPKGYNPPCPPDLDMAEAVQNSAGYQGMRAALEAGSRMTFLHAYTDGTYDAVFHMIEEAIDSGKLTLEEVRESRITLEHNMVVRPDQIEKLAKYGIMMSFQAFQVASSEKGEAFLNNYGEQYLKWLIPANSLADAGVKVLIGTDHHLTKMPLEAKSLTGVPVSWEDSIWPYYEFFVTRELDGKMFSPEEAMDRVDVLRGAGTVAAENLLRDKELGSLEVGKLADFIFIDKDYFTIPAKEIHSIQTLLTAVGGEVVYRSPDL